MGTKCVSGISLSVSRIRLNTDPEAPDWAPVCDEYAALADEKTPGNAALNTGRIIGTHALLMANAGSVTLQNAAQIMLYERSVKSTVVRTWMRMMVMAEML